VLREQQGRASRYDAIIATLVGVSALFVSGYTAHVQRQQVRAAVWRILEYSTSNEPTIHLTLDNKGVGPAIIRHVRVTVDGQPVPNWHEALQRLLGPGMHHFYQSTIGGHVLSAGESLKILVPYDDDGTPLTLQKPGPLWTAMNEGGHRIGMEVCYCSTLGECWTLRSGPNMDNSTVETGTCPGPSETSFKQ
jgi:hypothetical protein